MLVVGWTVGTATDFLWLLAICGYICFFSGVPTVLLRRFLKTRIRTAYLRASILIFFPTIAVSADLLQYFVLPSRVFDGTFSAYHILNPFRALGNWTQVEALGWQWGPMVMGIAGLIAYVELYRMGRREDKHASHLS